ncbi:MAG: PilZ domain-containing protein [Betaproteobacteria bacterium]|nr:PilZ domain-containing protein [Betaproteobacteria bacterium]
MQPGTQEKRREERVSTALPVNLGTATGITRDVSATGMFFETDTPYAVGNTISVELEMDTPQGKMLFKCQGQIVRVEPRNQRVGVAVKITDSTIKAAQV